MKKFLIGLVLGAALVTPLTAFAAAFKDVPVSHWASKTIEWGTKTGVVTGYPDQTFKPENSVTEEEFLTMLISAYVKRSDLQGAAKYWSDPYYFFAHDKNYPTEGWDEPTARRWKISRQRVAEIVAGATGVNYTGDDAIKWLLAKGLAKGKSGDVSVAGYKGADFLTRAEAVQFIKNAKENGLTELKVRPAQPSDPSAIPALPGQGSGQVPGQTQQPGTGQQPGQGQTPGQTQNPSTPPSGTVTTVTEVPSSNPEFLLPRDPATEPAVEAFLSSLRYKDGVVTGTIPSLPSGHVMTLTYKDNSDGKSGNRKNDKFLSDLKAGQSFSVPVVGQGGKLLFSIYQGNVGKNGVIVKVPSMQAEWGAKH
ncbi:hypothetical protein QO009_004067 [Brevibacillus aydinogluensis]|jgi:hypothetical protein|uniref:S-layer homology domain-containing protein n=1 Tax=Brevibacillus aydinogluensis TaxID=927786 RepID=UPI002892BB8C|nr:S-layer homology domain-containing protein [Brevibacillus aydinogluensis]MDT3418142.1 hypothetical protein [Brevibacillus aydinogluensis]